MGTVSYNKKSDDQNAFKNVEQGTLVFQKKVGIALIFWKKIFLRVVWSKIPPKLRPNQYKCQIPELMAITNRDINKCVQEYLF